MVKVGSVVQANENAGGWAGCLLIVTDVKSWGVQAGTKIPMQGTAYIRLRTDQFEYIGEAVLVEERSEDD